MFKKLLAAIIISVLVIGIVPNFNSVEAKTVITDNVKLKWGKVTVKSGDLGKYVIKKDTKIYKVVNNKLIYVKKAKKGSEFVAYEGESKVGKIKVHWVTNSLVIKKDSKAVSYVYIPKQLRKDLNPSMVVSTKFVPGIKLGMTKDEVQKIMQQTPYTTEGFKMVEHQAYKLPATNLPTDIAFNNEKEFEVLFFYDKNHKLFFIQVRTLLTKEFKDAKEKKAEVQRYVDKLGYGKPDYINSSPVGELFQYGNICETYFVSIGTNYDKTTYMIIGITL